MNWTYSGRPGYDLHDALAWCCKQGEITNYLEVKAALDLFLKGVTNCEVIEEAAGIQRNCTVLRKTRP